MTSFVNGRWLHLPSCLVGKLQVRYLDTYLFCVYDWYHRRAAPMTGSAKDRVLEPFDFGGSRRRGYFPHLGLVIRSVRCSGGMGHWTALDSSSACCQWSGSVRPSVRQRWLLRVVALIDCIQSSLSSVAEVTGPPVNLRAAAPHHAVATELRSATRSLAGG